MIPGLLLYLWDTNILVHYIRNDALAQRLESVYSFRAQPMSPLISVVTQGEIESLALQFGWRTAKQQRLQQLLGRLTIVPLDFAGIIDAYARLDIYYRRSGRPTAENDLWIAATAYATGARLVTTDSDFDLLDPVFLRRDWIDPKGVI